VCTFSIGARFRVIRRMPLSCSSMESLLPGFILHRGVTVLGYYNILILTPRDTTGHDYQSESVYFGESENMMRVKFLEAVRKAQASQSAEYVVIWHDLEQMVKVKIEH